ncbi:MAG: tetratricopeptide repeat protein, partial [Planctomycetota bacterium]
MNVSGRNLLLFLLGGVLGIAMLLAVPLPDLGRHGVDPRTAVRILSPADRVEKLQQLGNAQLALSRLRDLMKEAPRQVLYRNASALLEAELEPAPITKPRPEDLRRLRADEQSFPDLLRYLEGIEHDGRIGQATEQFFSLEPHPDHVGDPDARARALLGKIRLGKNRLSPRPFLRLAETFRKLGRQRAQVRWLLRGYGRHPASDQLRSELVRVYLERGQLEAAFAVTTQGTKWHRRHIAFWEQRAKIASWLSLPAAEARALEILLTMRDDRTARSRLVEIYPYLGEPELAVIHAVHLALGDGELSQQKSAVDFALTSGVTDLGIQLMEHIARRSEGPTEWLVKIAELSLQDLNFDRAISVYEGLARKHPDSEHEQRLEGLYRQRDMPEKLVDLLRRRLARHPEDSDLRSEVLNMLFGLGRRAEAIGIIRELAERPHSPRVFFQSLAQYEAIGIEGLAERGIGFALSPQMKPELLDLVFSALEPFIDRQEYREVAITLALRYPDHPASKRSRMLLIDVDHDDQKGAETAEELASLYPGDIEIHRVWLKRASWAGLIDSQIRARKRLLELDPEDDENRIELGELYLVEGRHEDAAEQFRFLAEIQGARSFKKARGKVDIVLNDIDKEDYPAVVKAVVPRLNKGGLLISDNLIWSGKVFGKNRDKATRCIREYTKLVY